MANRCWKDACVRLNNDDFVKKKSFGIACNDVPVHISFIYVGSKLYLTCSTSGNSHAEVNCLKKIYNLPRNKPIRIFITKVTGSHAMSRPCYHCSQLLAKHLPQARVYYTDVDNTLREDYFLDNTHISKGNK